MEKMYWSLADGIGNKLDYKYLVSAVGKASDLPQCCHWIKFIYKALQLKGCMKVCRTPGPTACLKMQEIRPISFLKMVIHYLVVTFFVVIQV